MTSSNLKPFEQWANRSAFLLLKWPFMRFHPKKNEQFHFITECLETPANGFSSPMSTCFFHGAALLVCLPHRENVPAYLLRAVRQRQFQLESAAVAPIPCNSLSCLPLVSPASRIMGGALSREPAWTPHQRCVVEKRCAGGLVSS